MICIGVLLLDADTDATPAARPIFGERRAAPAGGLDRARRIWFNIAMKRPCDPGVAPPRRLSACAPQPPAWLKTIGDVRFQVGDDPRWAAAGWDDSALAAGALVDDRLVRPRGVDARPRRRRGAAGGRARHVTVSAVGAYDIYWNGARVGGSRPAGARRGPTRCPGR